MNLLGQQDGISGRFIARAVSLSLPILSSHFFITLESLSIFSHFEVIINFPFTLNRKIFNRFSQVIGSKPANVSKEFKYKEKID